VPESLSPERAEALASTLHDDIAARAQALRAEHEAVLAEHAAALVEREADRRLRYARTRTLKTRAGRLLVERC
jgi:hypothetical protein